MTQTATNTEALELLKGINIEETELYTYIIKYRYAGDTNFFEKTICAECDPEAIFDAQAFVEEENAKVAGKPKSGNYIDTAFVTEWATMQTIAAIKC
jgi:hypothetical protein